MNPFKPLTRAEIARLVANDLPDGSYVNLGIGMPTMVADYLPGDREIILHSENGILGSGRPAVGDEIDPDLINASRTPVTLLPGASISEHTISFAMMRGGHLDYSILGGFQVGANGDLANWITNEPDAIAAIGGAMDLAVGARQVIVMMEHVARDGSPKILERMTYPPTGLGVVDHVYTDLAIIDVTSRGFVVRAMIEGLTLAELSARSGAPLFAPGDDAANIAVIRRDGEGHAAYTRG